MDTSRTAPRRRVTPTLAALVVILLAALLPPVSTPAFADGGMEAQFVAAVNSERAAQGLPALSVAGDLSSVARSHSRVMADTGNLHHNPNLGSAVSGWQKVGENVGRGPSVATIHGALMNSAGHRRNILDSDWTQLGVGVVVDSGGQIWVTQVFRKPVGAAPAPKPEPTPEPTPEAKPQPKPQTQAEPKAEPAPVAAEPGAAPEPEPEPEPEPVREPHPVRDQPLALDRMTLLLARQTAEEEDVSFDEVIAELLAAGERTDD